MQSLEVALAALARIDPDLVEPARTAWEWLTAGQGPEAVTQWRLQQFCWSELARRNPVAQHSAETTGDVPTPWETAGALAALLDELGLPRYAALARGPVTEQILAGGAKARDRGRTVAARAMERSGIEPPHTELLTWADVPGPAEARAREIVADRLELAIAAGDLTPGTRGWREQQTAITRSVLLTPIPHDRTGASLYDRLLDERLRAWVRRPRSTTRRGLLAPLVGRLRHPVDPGMAAPARELLRPVDWLLTEIGEGLPLTAAGYLPPRAVNRALDDLDWRDEQMGASTREMDALPVAVLREVCTRLGLVRRRGTRLVRTPAGTAAVQDGLALWHAIAAALIGPDHSAQAVTWEIVLALLEAGDPVDEDDALDLVRAVLSESGLRRGIGRDEADHDARPLFQTVLRELRWLGLVDEKPTPAAGDVIAREGAADLFRTALRHRVLHRDA